MKLKSEPVREPRQVVENPDYVRDLQATHLVKVERRKTSQSVTVTRSAVALSFSAIAHSARARGPRRGSSRHRRSLIAAMSSPSPPSARRNSAWDWVQ